MDTKDTFQMTGFTWHGYITAHKTCKQIVTATTVETKRYLLLRSESSVVMLQCTRFFRKWSIEESDAIEDSGQAKSCSRCALFALHSSAQVAYLNLDFLLCLRGTSFGELLALRVSVVLLDLFCCCIAVKAFFGGLVDFGCGVCASGAKD